MRALVVEDEEKINGLISERLKRDSFCVDSCYDGREAFSYLSYTEYDIIILDIMLPYISGLQVLKFLRQKNNNTPVLILTALQCTKDRVEGLNSGADDYLTKPFSLSELIARIHALLRRPREIAKDQIIIDDLIIDCKSRLVIRNKNEITLSSREFDILVYLARNAETVVTRDKIRQHLWDYSCEGCYNIIDVYIRYLRRKVDEGYPNKLIHTIRGRGYMMKA